MRIAKTIMVDNSPKRKIFCMAVNDDIFNIGPKKLKITNAAITLMYVG